MILGRRREQPRALCPSRRKDRTRVSGTTGTQSLSGQRLRESPEQTNLTVNVSKFAVATFSVGKTLWIAVSWFESALFRLWASLPATPNSVSGNELCADKKRGDLLVSTAHTRP